MTARRLLSITPGDELLLAAAPEYRIVIAHTMQAMEDMLVYQMLFWQSWPVLVVFYGAALTHMSLGIWALYQRRQFRWVTMEMTQLVFGLAIPALIIGHLIGIRLAASLYGHEKFYAQAFFAYWIFRPYVMWMLYAVLIVSWVHGCIGLYFWLRMKTWFKTAAPWLLAAAMLVPTLALLGFYQAGRTVIALSGDAAVNAVPTSFNRVNGYEKQSREKYTRFPPVPQVLSAFSRYGAALDGHSAPRMGVQVSARIPRAWTARSRVVISGRRLTAALPSRIRFNTPWPMAANLNTAKAM